MKKEFAVAAFNPKYKTFVVYIAILIVESGDKIHPSKKAQIVYLKANKALIKFPSKYTDFANVFFPKLIIKLPKHMRINDYAIKLIDN